MRRATTQTPDEEQFATLATPAAADRRFAVDAPTRSAFDQAIPIHVRGSEPGETVDVTARLTDRDGAEWQSSATFRADERGVVDLTREPPLSGTYEGVRPMGLFWSMASEGDQRVTALLTPADKEITIRATCGEQTAERTLTRTVAGDGVSRREIQSPAVAGTVFEPSADGPHPGVLCLHGSGSDVQTWRAKLLASHGFTACALRYFGDAEPVSDSIEAVPLSYFDDAAEWFSQRSSVAGDQLGVLGHSWGGQAALLLGARTDWAGAVVSYAGSGVVWDTPRGPPPWTADGDPVPFISGNGEKTLREGQLDEADADRRRVATIPAEETDGPVLLISGSEDPIWPARRLGAIAADRLRRADFDHAFEHLSYEDAGHFITPPYLPKRDPVFGGSAGGMARADVDSWPVVLSYLRRGLCENRSVAD